MIVDEPYTINEKYGEKYYQISIDSPDINQPVHEWDAECKVADYKKISALREKAKMIALAGRNRNAIEWRKVEL